jgi:hypothetical protein
MGPTHFVVGEQFLSDAAGLLDKLARQAFELALLNLVALAMSVVLAS